MHSPEINNNLLRLLHIQREIVVPAPPGQAAHLTPVVCLISVANETHHSRVIRKLDDQRFIIKTIHSLMVNYQRLTIFLYDSRTPLQSTNCFLRWQNRACLQTSVNEIFSQCARRKFYIQVVLLDKLQLCLYLK